jgi:hypothetical protein
MMAAATSHATSPRWFYWGILFVILALAVPMRWYRIDKESLSLDEYWALYLATGRGSELFQIPYNVIVQSPPKVGFAGAPPWWHIWTGLSSTTHPPLYHVILRCWVDWFGQNDLPIRALSLLFGIGAVALLFDAVRRIGGPWRALAAAGIMAFAQTQIDFSQTARPYTMMIFFGALLCDALISLQQNGPSTWKWTLITAATASLSLTHYFSVGAILGASIYALAILRGPSRKSAITAIAAGILFAAIIWGPVFWKTRHLYDAYQEFWSDPNRGIIQSAREIAMIPIRLLLDPWAESRWLAALPLAILVYVVPLFRFRKYPHLLLWWLWIVGTIGVVVAVDVIHHSTMVGVLRYVFLASPAVYAILATILPGKTGGVIAALMLSCAVIFGLSRLQAGPEPAEDWKTMAHLVNHLARPRDVVAILGFYKTEPAFDYFVIEHYAGDWKTPVIFLMDKPDPQGSAELASQPRVWIVGHDALLDTSRILPGWNLGPVHGVGKKNAFWRVIPPSPTLETR